MAIRWKHRVYGNPRSNIITRGQQHRKGPLGMTNPVQDREAPEKVPFGCKICREIFHSLKLNIIWIIHHEFMSTTIMAIQRSCYHILVFNCYTLNTWQNTFCKSPQYMIYFYIIGAHHLKVPLGWSKIAPFFPYLSSDFGVWCIITLGISFLDHFFFLHHQDEGKLLQQDADFNK